MYTFTRGRRDRERRMVGVGGGERTERWGRSGGGKGENRGRECREGGCNVPNPRSAATLRRKLLITIYYNNYIKKLLKSQINP